MSIITLKVEPERHHERLDVYLTRALADVPSRSFVQKLLDKGCVRVNHKEVKAHYKVQHNDVISVEIPEGALEPQPIEPENIPLDIFYEDESLLVVNKPCGMMVHPAQGHKSGTLVTALLFHCRRLSDFNGSTRLDSRGGLLTIDPERRPSTSLGPSPELVEGRNRRVNTAVRPGIVHRLDKETSGLLVVAKDNATHAQLASQFQKHRVKKHYVALVDGDVEFDEGIIDAPLGRHPVHHDLRDVRYDDSAKAAVTLYRVIKRHRGVTLISLFPKTGRTHQLRVHMDHIGHPILGDDKYGRKTNFPRLALHAQSLGFQHPARKCFMEFSCRTPREFLEKVALP
ncbi:MAG: RluA family pseudouridine synthase [Candidatus Omnitrophica bacterium]|nr:RluA family pseudouridine synthase [Candidatus Omnitrophota bacterium]